MRLVGPRRLARFRPGQFLMLGWTDGRDPLLPRPMSIRRVRQVQGSRFKVQVAEPQTRNPKPETRIAEVEILYKVCGRGTALLSTMRPGRPLRVLGPLGNGFTMPRSTTGTFLIAGGIGAPPITALAEKLAMCRASHGATMTVLLGGRSKADLLCIGDLKRVGAKIYVATEDGSAGHKGLVTELLEEVLHAAHFTSPHAPATKRRHGGIYACGPYPMLAALAPIAKKYGLPYQASLEAGMACGFGACMGCAVPINGGGCDLPAGQAGQTYRLVCQDGPVFNGYNVLWSIPSISSIRSVDQIDRP